MLIAFLQVLKQLPHFHRSGGRDHIFVFPRFANPLQGSNYVLANATTMWENDCACSGAGAHLLKDWDILLNRSIFLTPEVSLWALNPKPWLGCSRFWSLWSAGWQDRQEGLQCVQHMEGYYHTRVCWHKAVRSAFIDRSISIVEATVCGELLGTSTGKGRTPSTHQACQAVPRWG